MAADAWVLHTKAKEYLGDGTIDLDAHVFKVGLALSTSNIATVSVDALSTVTNQHAAANGYTVQTLGSVTWSDLSSDGTINFDCADPAFTASGGSIVARYAFIYDDSVTTPVADPILAHCLLDNTPADVTATDGNALTLQINAAGIFATN